MLGNHASMMETVMVRTQIQLSEEQARALKALSARSGLSVAELIRRSIDSMLKSSDGREEERRRRAIAAVGIGRSGFSDISVEHDKYLAEDFAS